MQTTITKQTNDDNDDIYLIELSKLSYVEQTRLLLAEALTGLNEEETLIALALFAELGEGDDKTNFTITFQTPSGDN